MNIGIFTDCYYPQVNGVVTSVMTLQEELKKRGHQVTVITVDVPGFTEKSENVIRIKSIPFTRYMDFRIAIPLYPSVFKTIKALNLDIIHTHTEFTIGLLRQHFAKTLEIPILHTYHTMYEDYSHYVSKHNTRVIKSLIRKGSSLYVNKYHAVIAPSDKTKYALKNYGVKRDIHVVPTGVDIREFERVDQENQRIREIKKALGILEGDKILLSLGRISKEKSIDILIRQMKTLKRIRSDVKLVIVGDGPCKAELEALTEELNLRDRVLFTGLVPFSEVPYYYSIGDMFLNASRTETQGLTIIEAMASMLPVIVFNDENVRDIVIEGYSGHLFSTEEELTAKILENLDNPESAHQLMLNGLNIVQGLTKEVFGENAEKVYEDLVNLRIQGEIKVRRLNPFTRRKEISNF